MISELKIVAAGVEPTILKESYFSHPFKLGNITEGRRAQTLRLMIMSSSPGVLNNDRYQVEIKVLEGSSLHLSTQGYQRLFTMTGSAVQEMNIFLHDKSSFTYLPHPTVPHTGSAFTGINNVYLQKNHRLTWTEILTCGRKLSGEKFSFRSYQNVTNIFVEDRLVIRENLLIEPAARDPLGLGQLQGYTHQSSFLFLATGVNTEQLIVSCREVLGRIDGISYGVSKLPVNGIIIRMHGNKGEQLFELHKQLENTINNLAPVE